MKTITLKASIAIVGLCLAILAVLKYNSSGQQVYAGRSLVTESVPSLKTMLQGLIYTDLLTNNVAANETSFYGAYFLEANRDNASYLSGLFSNWVPRVDLGTNNLIMSDNGIIDGLTRKPGKLFWARILSVSNDVAEADVGWYSGPQAAEYMVYRIRRTGTNWMIINRKTKAIS